MNAMHMQAIVNTDRGTAHYQLIETQRRALELFRQGHLLQPDQLDRALNSLIGSTRQMVMRRRSETHTAPRRVIDLTTTPDTDDDLEVIDLTQPMPSVKRTRVPTACAKLRSIANKCAEIVSEEVFQSKMDCDVCMNSCGKGSTITTSCRHVFCIECWVKWMKIRTDQSQLKNCPTCRFINPIVTYYRVNGKRGRRNVNLNENEYEQDVMQEA